MKVLLVHEAQFPVAAYGGTERVVWWLAKGLAELGADVTIACLPGSVCPFAPVVHPDFRAPLPSQLASFSSDVVHYFNTPGEVPGFPYLVTIGGNGKVGETFLPNTVFVSRNHAERHGAGCFVHNGLDPEEYEFRARKEDYLLFLAKASWKVKNVAGAIRIAKRSRSGLRIAGGSRWWQVPWSGVKWAGMIGGAPKVRLVSGAKGLVFPVLWHEPFGLAVIEALVSGTPVLGSPFGSLPELVTADVGKICSTETEFVEAVPSLGTFSPEACRQRVLTHFHYRTMAEKYLKLYGRVVAGELLNEPIAGATRVPEAGCHLSG